MSRKSQTNTSANFLNSIYTCFWPKKNTSALSLDDLPITALETIVGFLPLRDKLRIFRVAKKYRAAAKRVIQNDTLIQYIFELRCDALLLPPIPRIKISESIRELFTDTEEPSIQNHYKYLIAEMQQRKINIIFLGKLYEYLLTLGETRIKKFLALATPQIIIYKQGEPEIRSFNAIWKPLAIPPAEPPVCLSPRSKRIVSAGIIAFYMLMMYIFFNNYSEIPSSANKSNFIIISSLYTPMLLGSLYVMYYGCNCCTSVPDTRNNASKELTETVPRVTLVSHFITKHSSLFETTAPDVVIDVPEFDGAAPAPDELSPLLVYP
ncbi:MAG: hypothetical protein K0U29_02670 [Gammaproteobacteria bacterium]|nr:hypothetical protein [Gammaproteobacteria bacterium]MCH9743813.1 hypothetical protein [Gammaproteobacteria bacterium]